MPETYDFALWPNIHLNKKLENFPLFQYMNRSESVATMSAKFGQFYSCHIFAQFKKLFLFRQMGLFDRPIASSAQGCADSQIGSIQSRSWGIKSFID
jgi:hypothetical protein